jgi:uncharacterized membrane protein
MNSQDSAGAHVATFSEKDVADGRVISLVSYIIPIIGIIPLVQRKNAYAIYHGKQALTLLIAAVCVSVIEMLLFFVLAMMSLTIVITILSYAVLLAILALIVIGAMNAWNGKTVPLPVIGQYADVIFKGFDAKA